MKRFDDLTHPGFVYPARIPSDKIGLLGMLVEGHEGLAIVRTTDASLGLIEFWISPSMQKEFESFLGALREELGLYAGAPRRVELSALEQGPA